MKRRKFIIATALAGLSVTLSSKKLEKSDINSWLILEEALEILFPKTDTMPSSKEFFAIKYLKEVTSHSSFDKNDKKLLLEGALDFYSAFPKFLVSKTEEKEKFIKEANNSSYGQEWLNKVVYYGIEAMLSDPIYGGNKGEVAWKSLNHQTGLPQPKYKYAKVV